MFTKNARALQGKKLRAAEDGSPLRQRRVGRRPGGGLTGRVRPERLPARFMPAKPKALTETQFLALLDKVLAKVMSDLTVRSKIQEEVAKEMRLVRNLASFTKYAEEATVPDTAPATVAELQDPRAATFGEDATVSVTPADEEGGGKLAVEITLPDRTVSSEIKVGPGGAGEDDGEAQAPFVPFPVTLPTDPELVWVLARRENLGADEAGRALSSVEEEYWASKAGQQRLRKGAERNFAEFIENVPSAALLDSGMKRHYKIAEKLHALHSLGQGGGEQPPAAKPKPADNNLDHLFAPTGEPAEENDEPSWNA